MKRKVRLMIAGNFFDSCSYVSEAGPSAAPPVPQDDTRSRDELVPRVEVIQEPPGLLIPDYGSASLQRSDSCVSSSLPPTCVDAVRNVFSVVSYSGLHSSSPQMHRMQLFMQALTFLRAAP